MAQVRILRREEFMDLDPQGNPVEVVAVTFESDEVPPLTINIPKAQYNPDREKQAIRDAIAALKPTPPEVLEL